MIVESPAKARTIEKFLGKEFFVASCFGHIRDLVKKDFGIDKEKNYQPNYEVSPDKKKVVTQLIKLVKNAGTVWIASDEDREGEAIAWHLSEVLGLDPENTKRIVFHEITKDAIIAAISNPRKINQNLVDSQQARRILDRLVGFELSPILWRKIKPALSAGRVQSVAVRLLVEREREILKFKSTSYYKVTGLFKVSDETRGDIQLKAELDEKIKSRTQVLNFLENCKDAEYQVIDIVTKPSKKSPAPPFITSTLQQEASRKLGFSVSRTMKVAQKLYEAGKITYMRTDSVHLSSLAINTAKVEITREYGSQYVKSRQYKTKTKGAQEAHEAIRPTFLNNRTVGGSQQEKKLYDLIWKRTIASQMSEALLEKTTVTIKISNSENNFIAKGEVIKFDGFLKVYIESIDDEIEENYKGLLPPVKLNDILMALKIEAIERFSQRPFRFTEASLVKRLEELGIGRPSTYAPIISTIQLRGYVLKEDRPGVSRDYGIFSLENNTIKEVKKTEMFGMEKNKIFPTDIGMIVNDFLVKHFEEILDYNFTALVEREFDEIAEGKMIWYKMIDAFYQPFHKKVVFTTKNSERNKGERKLGVDPSTGRPVFVKIGRYGPMAQLGESSVKSEASKEEKPRFARLQKNHRLETITLEEALELFKLPRNIGEYENGEVVVAVGKFGPYIRHKSSFYALKKGVDDPFTLQLDRAMAIIEEKRESDKKKLVKAFLENEEVRVLKGRWGPYITYQKQNFKIPKNKNAEELTLEECLKLIEKGSKKNKRKGSE